MQTNANPKPSRKLTGHERPSYLHFARITWAGSFPVDMLRYDHCFPVCEQHAREMEASQWSPGESHTAIVARYSHSAKWPFTPARWDSFCARCEPTDGHEVGFL